MKIFLCFALLYYIALTSAYRTKNVTTETVQSKKLTNFMDLHADCLLIIFEDLHLYDLINLSEINTKLWIIVEDILRRRLAKKRVVLDWRYYSSEPKYLAQYKDEEETNIEIAHLPMISRFFPNFGHLVRKLAIYHYFEINETHAQIMYQLINSHCTESLTELLIYDNRNNIFAEFTKPFKNVESIYLDGNFISLDNSNRNFSELFPSLRKLRLEKGNLFDLNVSDHKFPHLEFLDVDSWAASRAPSIKKLIKNHPKIQTLILTSVEGDLFQFIADELPNIEELQISLFDQKRNYNASAYFHFEHIKSFSFGGYTHYFPLNISFGDSLKVLKMNAFTVHSEKLIEMVFKYKNNLKILHLDYVELNDEQILQLADADFHLDELKIKCKKGIELENIFKLIENLKENSLKHLAIFFTEYNFRETAINILTNRLADEWSISEDGYYIYLDRKLVVEN